MEPEWTKIQRKYFCDQLSLTFRRKNKPDRESGGQTKYETIFQSLKTNIKGEGSKVGFPVQGPVGLSFQIKPIYLIKWLPFRESLTGPWTGKST